jgi:hypothetical protein
MKREERKEDEKGMATKGEPTNAKARQQKLYFFFLDEAAPCF